MFEMLHRFGHGHCPWTIVLRLFKTCPFGTGRFGAHLHYCCCLQLFPQTTSHLTHCTSLGPQQYTRQVLSEIGLHTHTGTHTHTDTQTHTRVWAHTRHSKMLWEDACSKHFSLWKSNFEQKQWPQWTSYCAVLLWQNILPLFFEHIHIGHIPRVSSVHTQV